MVESAKFQAVQVTQRFSLYGIFKLDKNPCVISNVSLLFLQARLYEGKEPIQFFVIFQSLLVFKVYMHLMAFSCIGITNLGLT
jgi:hypothetical protein